jgi:signal transduction histidine kinase
MRPKYLLIFRVLLIATLLLIVLYSSAKPQAFSLAVLFGIYALFSAGTYLADRAGRVSDGAALAPFIADVALSTWILHLSRAVESHFYIAFFLIILSSAFLEKLAYSFIVGGVACLVYAVGAFPSLESLATPARLLNLALLLVISFFSAAIAHYIKNSQESLAARYEKKLAWMERLSLLGHALSAILHDLKTPLNAIDLTVEHLRELPDLGKNKEAARGLDAIRTESDKASAIVKDYLDFLKPSADGPGRADLREALLKVLAARRPQIDRQKIHLAFAAGDSFAVPIPERQIMRTFDNVIANAVEAMPHGGNLGVWITSKDHRAVVTIADTGIGMDPETLDRVFEPMESNSSKGPGRGFGLAIARWIVLKHGGDIALRSERGRGTTIEFDLPTLVPKRGQ